MQVENTRQGLGYAGFQTPQLTVFGNMSKIGCHRVHSISEKASVC